MNDIYNIFIEQIKNTTNSYQLINWLKEKGVSNVGYMILDSAFKGMALSRLPHTLLIIEDDFKRNIIELTELLKEYQTVL